MPASARLTESQLEHFHEEGFLIVEDVFDPAALEPLRRELEERIDVKIEQLHANGKLEQKHSGEPFERRVTSIYRESKENGEAILRDLEGSGGGGYTGREMFNLITYPSLLDVVEALCGPELVGSSVYRIRPKLPKMGRGIIPWHQDSGYFSPICDSHLILTCWVPLIDSNEHNGCMQILPRAHRAGIVPHRTGDSRGLLTIEETDLPNTGIRPVVAACPRGGVVLMSNLTPHCSTPNHSDDIRWSVDLRYQSARAPNNVAVLPPAGQPFDEASRMSCYPPEADFIVRSRRAPASVTSYEEFCRRRTHFESLKDKPYPQRGWTPLSTTA